jgi:protein-S-isoprenylcysteine O-methyltransferase Ste14
MQKRVVSAMKATDFEYRHQTLIHQFLVAAAFLTYLIDRDDVVWRFVKDSTAPRQLERALFTVATLFIAFGAGISTWARAYRRPKGTTSVGLYRYLRHPRHLGDLSYAIGLGSLAPLCGFVILLIGEALRVLRLIRLHDERTQNFQQDPVSVAPPPAYPAAKKHDSGWRNALRKEAVKWGILLTMIVFVITLRDRLAEVLAASSFLIGLLLNAPSESNTFAGS